VNAHLDDGGDGGSDGSWLRDSEEEGGVGDDSEDYCDGEGGEGEHDAQRALGDKAPRDHKGGGGSSGGGGGGGWPSGGDGPFIEDVD
jgi:hypothetical protein